MIKKYGDDRGSQLAALITYYGFLSLFPLLLLGVAILLSVIGLAGLAGYTVAQRSREIMDLLAPRGPVYQAGTLSGNPLAMAAGIATLRELKLEQDTLLFFLSDNGGPTMVAATVVTFDAIDVAVFVTTFCTPPMSFEIRDCTSPVRVRVKKASDSRCRCRKTAARRSCITRWPT